MLVQLGIDPIWFGVLFVVNMQLAQITPPVGIVLYTMTGISGRPMAEVIRGVTPFIFVIVVFLGLVMLFPEMALWLPRFTR